MFKQFVIIQMSLNFIKFGQYRYWGLLALYFVGMYIFQCHQMYDLSTHIAKCCAGYQILFYMS